MHRFPWVTVGLTFLMTSALWWADFRHPMMGAFGAGMMAGFAYRDVFRWAVGRVTDRRAEREMVAKAERLVPCGGRDRRAVILVPAAPTAPPR